MAWYIDTSGAGRPIDMDWYRDNVKCDLSEHGLIEALKPIQEDLYVAIRSRLVVLKYGYEEYLDDNDFANILGISLKDFKYVAYGFKVSDEVLKIVSNFLVENDDKVSDAFVSAYGCDCVKTDVLKKFVDSH